MTHDARADSRCEACGGVLLDLTERHAQAVACPRCAGELLVYPPAEAASANPHPRGGVVAIAPDGQTHFVVAPVPAWIALATFGVVGALLAAYAAGAWLVAGELGLGGGGCLGLGLLFTALAVVSFFKERRRPWTVASVDARRRAFLVEVNGRVALRAPFDAVQAVRWRAVSNENDDDSPRYDVCLVLDAASIAVARFGRESAERFARELAGTVGACLDEGLLRAERVPRTG